MFVNGDVPDRLFLFVCRVGGHSLVAILIVLEVFCVLLGSMAYDPQTSRGEDKIAGKILFHASKSCFETESGAQLRFEHRADQTIDIGHVFVPPADRGKGLAAQLMSAALAHAEQSGLEVIASCSYAAAYLKKRDRPG